MHVTIEQSVIKVRLRAITAPSLYYVHLCVYKLRSQLKNNRKFINQWNDFTVFKDESVLVVFLYGISCEMISTNVAGPLLILTVPYIDGVSTHRYEIVSFAIKCRSKLKNSMIRRNAKLTKTSNYPLKWFSNLDAHKCSKSYTPIVKKNIMQV
jgi:hypothetical protein